MNWKRVTCIVAIFVVGAVVYAETRNLLIVRNESGQAVQDLTVSVGDKTIQFGDMSPTDSRRSLFRFSHSATFRVRGRLADGAEIDDFVGYVVSEESLFGIKAVLTIRPEGELTFSH